MSTLALALLIVLVLLIVAGLILEPRAQHADYQHFRPPGKRVEVDGHHLYYLRMGEKRPGAPTILLESGHGDWSMAWRKVQPEIARFARVISYDRAGFGWSDPGPRPRTPDRLVSELHSLLEQIGESGPYLLVGHSMGGALSRLFYQRYPGEVVGMVWVDSAHEDLARYLAFWQRAYISFLMLVGLGAGLARVGLMRLLGSRPMLSGYTNADPASEQAILAAQLSTSKFFNVLYDETTGMMQSKNWTETPQSLLDLPVISIEALYTPKPAWYVPLREWQQFLTGWQSMHDDIAQLSTSLRRVPVQSGHVVMIEHPQVVIDAIRELYQWVTGDALPG